MSTMASPRFGSSPGALPASGGSSDEPHSRRRRLRGCQYLKGETPRSTAGIAGRAVTYILVALILLLLPLASLLLTQPEEVAGWVVQEQWEGSGYPLQWQSPVQMVQGTGLL